MMPLGLPPRRPILAASTIALATLLPSSLSHAVPYLPKPTKTIPYHEISVLAWPLAATDAPTDPGYLLPRQLNTICGYIGGNPGLPATCTAGSYCALDVEHKAVGCCPDGVPCTTGVFTDCVDSNSDPQTEINPYVFTCRGAKVCYRNEFEGGFSQFGCGSASDMAATVAITASGKSRVPFSTFSAALTEKPKSLTKPTTIGTKHKTSHSSSDSSRSHSRTHTRTDSSTSASTTASQTSDADNAPAIDAPARNNGAIIGGTISGVAFLAALLVLGGMLWRRYRNRNLRQGPGMQIQSTYIEPIVNRNHFEPLTAIQEENEGGTAQEAVSPIRHVSNYNEGAFGDGDGIAGIAGTSRYVPQYPYGYGPGSLAGGVMSVGGMGTHMESDQEPLTRREQAHDDYTGDFMREQNRTPSPGLSPPQEEYDLGTYPGRRPGSRGVQGSAFWHQNRP